MNYYIIPGIVSQKDITNISVFINYAKRYYGELWKKIVSKDRTRQLVDCRFIISNWLRKMGFSFREIGIEIGGRDHSTVMYNLSQYKNMYETSNVFKADADRFNLFVKN